MTRSIPLYWCVLVLLALLPCHTRAATGVTGTQIAVLSAAAVMPTAAAVLHGDYDGNFQPVLHGLLRSPDDHPAWYRVQLAKNWGVASPPLLVLQGVVRAKLVVYLPPAYLARTVSTYSADLDPRFSRHALVFELPRDYAPISRSTSKSAYWVRPSQCVHAWSITPRIKLEICAMCGSACFSRA